MGLSDHSFGSLGAVVGVALGACVIEKHVKLEGVKSADSEFSMTFDEYHAMIEECSKAKTIARGPDYTLTDSEKKSTVFRRSIYAAADITKGEIFTEDNIKVIRPGYGLAPKYYKDLLGEKAKRDIRSGERITTVDL